MKNLFPLFIILIIYSCTTPNPEIEQKSILNKAFGDFILPFKDIDLPYIVLDDKGSEMERITYKKSIEYLGVKWLDEENMIPNEEVRAIGKFMLGDSVYCLLYRSLELPVGSGNNISYRLASFKPDGTLIDQSNIAAFKAWEGGYIEQTCTIENDQLISIQYMFEDEIKNTKGSYKKSITINSGIFKSTTPDGTVATKEQEGNNLEYKELANYAYPPIIKKSLSGLFAKGYEWEDKLGKNYLIATTKSMASVGEDEDAMDNFLYVSHFVDVGEKYPKILWKTTDFVKGCSFDSMLSLIDGSFSITDLDNDNIAETIYMYSIGCVSDVSPYPLKLIMHEGEDKMAIRGMIKIDLEGYETESEYEIDEDSFEGKPEIFKISAESHWLKNEVVSY